MSNAQTNDVWITRKIYEDAEIAHFENLAKSNVATASVDVGLIKDIEKKVADFEKSMSAILKHLDSLDIRVSSIEQNLNENKKVQTQQTTSTPPSNGVAKNDDDDDDDVDLFGSDSEGESDVAAKVREERLAAYAAKKSKKPVLIAKSNVILDVKPWDDETDMAVMEQEVRKIIADGLLWGAAKLVPLAYGIKKLTISCVVEDDKVSIDWLTEEIEKIEDYVQSVDIAAFNKI